MRIREAFNEFDEALKLDPDERQAAISLHHKIREVLAVAEVCGYAILQGSFARKTMLAPLRDIDMIGFLHEKYRPLMNTTGGVAKAMDLMEAVLRKAFPQATFERSRHAIKIDFPELGFTFDLVPAFDREDSELIDIANLDTDSWDESNTRVLMRVVRERNDECDGAFIHQVRMIKHWARYDIEGLFGLYRESAAYDGIKGPADHPDAVLNAFRALEEGLELGIQYDPTRVDNLHLKLDEGVADEALPRVREARQTAQEAVELEEAGDTDAALAVWYSIFGDPFPKPPTQSVEDAFTNSLKGGLTTTGVATASSAARAATPPVRPWRPL